MSADTLAYESDLELVKEYCESKSDKAATKFVRTYQRFVLATALRYVGNYEDADDIAQEVFIKALNNLSSFRGKSSLKTWLYRITVNVCINYKRKKSLFSLFSRDDDNILNQLSNNDFNPVRTIESDEFEKSFIEILSKLPPKQRETFALRYFDDLSYEEISSMVGTTVGGLKANYFQAVKKLAELLEKK